MIFRYVKRDAAGTARTEIAVVSTLGLAVIVLVAVLLGWHVGIE
jgi:hypothetical protein